jgi:hypothetical protein
MEYINHILLVTPIRKHHMKLCPGTWLATGKLGYIFTCSMSNPSLRKDQIKQTSPTAMEMCGRTGLLEQNQSRCGEHINGYAAAGVAAIRLSHWCVPGNERCAYRGTLMGVHKIWTVNVRFEVFTAVTMKNGVFWVVMPCGSCKNRRFGGTWRLRQQGDKSRCTRNNTSCN